MKILQGTLVLSAAAAALAFTAAPFAMAQPPEQPGVSSMQPMPDNTMADHSQMKDKKAKAKTGSSADTSATSPTDETTSSTSPNTVNPAPGSISSSKEASPPTGMGSMESTQPRGGVTDADPPK